MSSASASALQKLKKDIENIKKEKETTEIDTSDPVAFVEKYIAHPENKDGSEWFKGREYLKPIYRDESDNLLFVKARQMEITEFAVNRILYWALKWPGSTILYASSTRPKAFKFSKDRLRKQILRSPAIKRFLGEADVQRLEIGSSRIYIYSAYNKMDTLRSFRADALILDEFQDTETDALPIAMETMAHSPYRKLIIIGTPKEAGSKFEEYWNRSTKHEWNSEKKVWEQTANIENPLFKGYHISQKLAIGLWLTEEQLETKRRAYSTQQYINEVLGEFYSGLGRPLTVENIWLLFDEKLPRASFAPTDLVVAGVDWGFGRKAHTVMWINKVIPLPNNDYKFETIYIERIERARLEEHIKRVIDLAIQFNVRTVACDSRSAYLYNQEVYQALGSRTLSITYVNRHDVPWKLRQIQFGNELLVDRTWAIDTTFDVLSKSKLKIYNEPDYSFREYIVNNITSQYPDVREVMGQSKKEWRHDPNLPDDAFHAMVYSILAYLVTQNVAANKSVSQFIGFPSS